MKTRTLPAGSTLYHGTDAPGEFSVPTAPAWFCLDEPQAKRWAGWASCVRPAGTKRVLTVRTTAAIVLLDTVLLADWQSLCKTLCAGDEDPEIWTAVWAVVKAGHAGWYGQTEIMLTDTDSLQPVGATPV